MSKEKSSMIQENEIPKYLKSTESNISKSNRKSNHKHQYNECLIQYKTIFIGKIHLNTGLYTYCTICAQTKPSIQNTMYLNQPITINQNFKE